MGGVKHYKSAARCLISGVLIATVAFLLPHFGGVYYQGSSIYEVAVSGTWGKWLEWGPMLCGISIMLIGISIYLFLTTLEELAFAKNHQRMMIGLFWILIIASLSTLCFGLYCLAQGLF